MLAVAEPLTLVEALTKHAASTGPALFAGQREVSYPELVERIRVRVGEMALPTRSLVALSGPNSLDWVVSYLALLAAGHVPLLVAQGSGNVASGWRPNATVMAGHKRFRIDRHHDQAIELHPELALLLSTSGSTGCPKLVRLSHRNMVSNARSIVDFQSLTASDRGITSLPLHYCFGLSVLNSHLLAGASVVVTDASVVDPCFAAELRGRGVTNLAGVPHTYDLLERVELDAPSLRLLAQAGGRLSPDRVTSWLDRADSIGAEFMVMYGQTEATARIAYLKPTIARAYPAVIGRPVPGTSLHLTDVDEHGVGELVTRGDHVMMGYATDAADLARGHEHDELRTGDLARYHDDGDVYEITGRRSRFVKPFGLRIDLDHVERALRKKFELSSLVVSGDDQLVVVIAPNDDSQQLFRAAVEHTGLPAGALVVLDDTPVPLTASGKPDYLEVLRRGQQAVARTHEPLDDVGTAFTRVLGRSNVEPTDTFVSLGGDSLSYVECSIRLEQTLGVLPQRWHVMTVAELSATTRPAQQRSTRYAAIDTTVVLRAIGICLIVCTHMRLWHIPGGAHTILAVAGYNMARFMGSIDDARGRFAAGMRTAARAAVPTVVWVAVGMLMFGAYSAGTLLLVNNYVGPPSHRGDHWHFWFIEVFAHLVVLTTVLFALPGVRSAERRLPYVAPLVVLAAVLVLRLEWAQMGDWYNLRFRTHGVAWFFVLGWLIYRSVTVRQRIVTTLVCLAVVPGFFDNSQRDWMIAGALIALVWFRTVLLPQSMIRPIGVVAAASMWIYISHFTIWPPLLDRLPIGVAYVATLVCGVGVWFTAERLLGLLNTWRQGRPNHQFTPPSSPIGGVA